MRRINVIGTSAVGKSTLARQLAARLNIPHVELDALHWEPNWIEAPDPVFRQRVDQATTGPAWVVDGNYAKIRDLLWPRLDAIVWLDYSFGRTLFQSIIRTFRRSICKEPCCNGNRESLWRMFSPDSIIWWVIKTHTERRNEFQKLLPHLKKQGVQVTILNSPAQTTRWLNQLKLPVSRAPRPS